MRREYFRPIALMPLVLGLVACSTTTSKAQFTAPRTARLTEVNQRSGLFTRFQPKPISTLPTDPNRDNFYGTRYGDYPVVGRSNNFLNGGMYGQTLDSKCTQSVAPYFFGSAGGNANCKDCRPWSQNGLVRLAQGFARPFKPVGGYYQNGNYVPIYDLDPLVPGPGPDLWPHFLQTKDDGSFFGH